MMTRDPETRRHLGGSPELPQVRFLQLDRPDTPGLPLGRTGDPGVTGEAWAQGSTCPSAGAPVRTEDLSQQEARDDPHSQPGGLLPVGSAGQGFRQAPAPADPLHPLSSSVEAAERFPTGAQECSEEEQARLPLLGPGAQGWRGLSRGWGSAKPAGGLLAGALHRWLIGTRHCSPRVVFLPRHR